MKRENSNISGVLVVNKAEGMTSHDVVNRIRRLYGTRVVGHTGTLDPMATGVLCILIGRAAKAAEYIVADTKHYRALLRLGETYDTGDITGNLLTKSENIPSFDELKSAAEHFVGDIKQIPPMYSAIKVGGKKLVDLARQGIEIEREARDITVYSIDCKETEHIDEFVLDVVCSKGTYIRTLCEDIGARLGCGGTMAALTRVASGKMSLDGAYTLEQIEQMSEEERVGLLMDTEELFASLPSVSLGEFFERLSRSGSEIYQKKIKTGYAIGQRVRICGKNGFFALGEVRDYPDGSAIKAIKTFNLE